MMMSSISPIGVLSHAIENFVVPINQLEALVLHHEDGPNQWIEYVRGGVGPHAVWGYWRLFESPDGAGTFTFTSSQFYSLKESIQSGLHEVKGLSLPEFSLGISPDLIYSEICSDNPTIIANRQDFGETGSVTTYTSFEKDRETLHDIIGRKNILFLNMELGDVEPQHTLPVPSGVYKMRRDDLHRILAEVETTYPTMIRTGLNTPTRYFSLAQLFVGFEPHHAARLVSTDTWEALHTPLVVSSESESMGRILTFLETDKHVQAYRAAYPQVRGKKYGI